MPTMIDIHVIVRVICEPEANERKREIAATPVFVCTGQ